MNKQRLIAYGMLLATTALWGIAPPIIKFTLNDFSPIIFLTYRFFIAVLITLPIFVLTDDKFPKLSLKGWLVLTAAGLLGSSINLGLLFWGIDNTTASASSVIGSTGPVVVVLAGAVFLKEKITNHEVIGLFIAFAGSLLITLSPSLNHTGGSIFGNLLIIFANFSWVAFLILCKKYLYRAATPLFLVTSSFVLGFFSLLPFAIMETGSLSNLIYTAADGHLFSHLGVLYMAIFSGTLAYWLYQEGQKRIEVSEASIFSYLNPLFAIPLSILWLGEQISQTFVAGAVVITVGVALAEYKKRRYNSKL